jgi:hypothetical protein
MLTAQGIQGSEEMPLLPVETHLTLTINGTSIQGSMQVLSLHGFDG